MSNLILVFQLHLQGFLFGSFSYIADRSPVGDRAVRIVVAEGIMILISAIVSVCIGFWIDASGFLQPFIAILGVYIFSLLYLLFIPESLISPPNINKLTLLIRISHFKETFNIFLIQGRKGRLIKICCAAFFINLMAFSGKLNVLFLFIMRPPLNWNSIDIGIYAAVSTIASSLLAFILLIVLLKYIRLLSISAIGMLSSCLSHFTQALAFKTWVMYVSE